MVQSSSLSPQAQLNKVVEALNAKQLDTAQALLSPLLAKGPGDPTLLYLQGGIHAERGDHRQAIKALEGALAANRAQPQVWQSLGLAQHRLGEARKGMASLRQALAIAPKFPQAAMNLGRLAMEMGDGKEARAAFVSLASMLPQDPTGPRQLVALALREDDFVEAESQLAEAERRKPGDAITLRLKARVLAQKGEEAEALAVYRRLIDGGQARPDLLQEGAREAFRAGAFEEAQSWISRARAVAPTDASLLLDGCRMAYALDDPDWFSPVMETVEAFPTDAGLLAAAAHIATLGGHGADVLALLQKSAAQVTEPRFLSALGLLEAEEGSLSAGLERQRGAAAAHDEVDINLNHALLALRQGSDDEAEKAVDRVLRDAPDNQLGLAYRVSVLRGRNDKLAQGLFDPERFTQKAPIECPPGYDNLAAFNEALAQDLLTIHQTDRQPLDQSLRGGTQVELSRVQHRVQTVGLLASALKSNVRNFIAGLPEDARHPFLSRRPDSVAFSGLWSVRLTSGGHHVPHAHPEGWLSSSYYVSLPPSVAANESHEGWLRLGMAPWQAPDDVDTVDIEPEEGHLILFPSYFWHGTVPFQDDRPRLTVAFDIRPGAR